MSKIVQFPTRPAEPEDDWIFTATIVRSRDGRAYLYLDDVRPKEFETDESASERMRRLGMTALEASANMLVIAEGLTDPAPDPA